MALGLGLVLAHEIILIGALNTHFRLSRSTFVDWFVAHVFVVIA